MLKRISATAFLSLFFAGLLVGCNTMEGAGEDLERGGEKIQEKANDAKD